MADIQTNETASRYYRPSNPSRQLLAEVQRRLPSVKRRLREAFTTDHRQPVLVPFSKLTANTFYYLDDITAHAFSDAVIELASAHPGGRLTVSYPFSGEFRAQQHRLQHIAPKFSSIRVFGLDQPRDPARLAGGVEYHAVGDSPLARYRVAFEDERWPVLFISRDTRRSPISDGPSSLGFFTFDPDVIESVAEDIDQLLHGMSRKMTAFHRLETLHRTTQKVARELESYSRRMELAIQRAQRRPDLLTADRLDRILNQCATKMRELEEIPRRAIRAIDRAKH